MKTNGSSLARPFGRRMWSIARPALLGTALCALAAPTAQTQRRGVGQGRQLSVTLGVGLGVGDLGRQTSSPGVGVALRTSTPLGASDWSLRTDVGFDRFAGKGDVDNQQFITFASNVVHHTSARLYQFGGLGIFTSKRVVKPANLRNESAFGLQAGVGLEFGNREEAAGVRPFVEFGVTDVFTTGVTSVWFPVRIGLRL